MVHNPASEIRPGHPVALSTQTLGMARQQAAYHLKNLELQTALSPTLPAGTVVHDVTFTPAGESGILVFRSGEESESQISVCFGKETTAASLEGVLSAQMSSHDAHRLQEAGGISEVLEVQTSTKIGEVATHTVRFFAKNGEKFDCSFTHPADAGKETHPLSEAHFTPSVISESSAFAVQGSGGAALQTRQLPDPPKTDQIVTSAHYTYTPRRKDVDVMIFREHAGDRRIQFEGAPAAVGLEEFLATLGSGVTAPLEEGTWNVQHAELSVLAKGALYRLTLRESAGDELVVTFTRADQQVELVESTLTSRSVKDDVEGKPREEVVPPSRAPQWRTKGAVAAAAILGTGLSAFLFGRFSAPSSSVPHPSDSALVDGEPVSGQLPISPVTDDDRSLRTPIASGPGIPDEEVAPSPATDAQAKKEVIARTEPSIAHALPIESLLLSQSETVETAVALEKEVEQTTPEPSQEISVATGPALPSPEDLYLRVEENREAGNVLASPEDSKGDAAKTRSLEISAIPLESLYPENDQQGDAPSTTVSATSFAPEHLYVSEEAQVTRAEPRRVASKPEERSLLFRNRIIPSDLETLMISDAAGAADRMVAQSPELLLSGLGDIAPSSLVSPAPDSGLPVRRPTIEELLGVEQASGTAIVRPRVVQARSEELFVEANSSPRLVASTLEQLLDISPFWREDLKTTVAQAAKSAAPMGQKK